ncbi:M23 family metallopeptidase [Nocardioides sp. InS609-2]|uniref:M23 family metallopeptidase n=1 Tax=Nocardioides sp. InS609-2 TaxID=2760705 RepID=UPI0020BE6E85|nr:M23 family metallopeptidase [Nocardioides sp. InS609-2]
MSLTWSHAFVPAATAFAVAGAVLVSATSVLGAAAPTTAVSPTVAYDLPFSCGQAWSSATRARHSPSRNAIDFNRPDDAGSSVVAAARGVVTTAVKVDRGGYGRYVVVDHGNDESSLYAHLKAVTVQLGQSVDKGALLGALGASGNASGPHLHFEERSGRSVVSAILAGVGWKASTLTSANCVDLPVAANLGGDAVAELMVFRRTANASFEAMPTATYAGGSMPFGVASDEPVVGDWNGDGLDDLGVRAPRTGNFKLSSPAGVTKLRYGVRGDLPVAGDWNGDGPFEVGVRRPSTSSFLLRRADGTTTTVAMGDANDLPVTGDWNGDGVSDLGVYDQATSTFTLRVVDATGIPVTAVVPFGLAGDLPVIGDWDGNGTSDVGTWAPGTATFSQRQAPLAMSAARSVTSVQWGNPRR